MKKNLFIISAVLAIALASCTTVSELDPTIVSAMSSQSSIEFSSYAASSTTTTKGTPITSNDTFKSTAKSFNVSALVSEGDFTSTYDSKGVLDSWYATPDEGDASTYFGFNTVNYDTNSDSWDNTTTMYWPNDSKILHFAAYAPSTLAFVEDTKQDFSYSVDGSQIETYNFSFNYNVDDDIEKHTDVMYAMTSVDYLAPSDRSNYDSDTSYITNGIGDNNDENPVNLHFKHALTQIAFTAIKESSIDVYVKSITICNVYNSGKFTATMITDDADTSDAGDDTVGNSADSDDLVNGENFGTWENDFSGSWQGLTTSNTAAPYSYYVTTGSGGHSSMSNYAAKMAAYDTESPLNTTSGTYDSIKITSEDATAPIALTMSDNVLMLMPQKLTKWTPCTSTVTNYVGMNAAENNSAVLDQFLTDDNKTQASSTKDVSLSYLTIDCEIYKAGITTDDGKLHDGYIFVPFSTEGITYSSASVDNSGNTVVDADEWLAGYKITYCLNFGGGYIVAEGDHGTIPEPGCIPDTDTYTLREITYDTSTDSWVNQPVTQTLNN